MHGIKELAYKIIWTFTLMALGSVGSMVTIVILGLIFRQNVYLGLFLIFSLVILSIWSVLNYQKWSNNNWIKQIIEMRTGLYHGKIRWLYFRILLILLLFISALIAFISSVAK